MTDVASFYSNVTGLYFDDFGIHRIPNVESSEIIELLKWALQQGWGFVSGDVLY